MSSKRQGPKPVADVLRAARKVTDPLARAAFLERNLDAVDKPHKLIAPVLDALYDAPEMSAEEAVGRLREIERSRPDDVPVLRAIARALEQRYFEAEALEVLRGAIAAGAKDKRTLELVGRLLTLRGDAEGAGYLERAIARDPEWDEPRVALALWLADREAPRALALLEATEDPYGLEVRAMLLEAAGRERAAGTALEAAIACFDSELEARQALRSWHFQERRFGRALVHARAALALRATFTPRQLAAIDVVELDTHIIEAFHQGGAFAELLPWLVERCAGELPVALAEAAYQALTSLAPIGAPELAIRAAHVMAVDADARGDRTDARAWRVSEAALHARDGDLAELDALQRDGLDADPDAWVALADAYVAVGAHAAAHACVERVLQLDPSSADVLATQFTLGLEGGDLAAMQRAAEALAQAKPTWHQGPEYLGRCHARRGEAALALATTRRAVAIAPDCHNAWLALAEALVLTGDLVGAREAVARSRVICDSDDLSVISAALAGDLAALDRALVECYAHLPALPFPSFFDALRAACHAASAAYA